MSDRKHLAVRGYGRTGLVIACRCKQYQPIKGTARQQEDAHRAHRVDMGETVKARVPTTKERLEQARRIAVELENENARLRGLLETLTKAWGKEQDAELAYSDSYTGTDLASLAYQRGATLERCGDDIRHLLENGEMPDWYDADAAAFDAVRAAS